MNFLTATLTGAAALCAASAALADAAESQAVWQRHVEAAMDRNVDAIMADFTDQSAIITPDGVLSGRDAIRRFFEAFFDMLEPGAFDTLTSNAEVTYGNVLVSNFTIGAIQRTFHDTAIIGDDRIMVLTTVNYPAE